MTADISYDPTLLTGFIRRHYLAKLKKWKSGAAEKQQFILRHEISTPAERQCAEQWLAAHGYSDDQISVMRRR
jgi:hypothetical protein